MLKCEGAHSHAGDTRAIKGAFPSTAEIFPLKPLTDLPPNGWTLVGLSVLRFRCFTIGGLEGKFVDGAEWSKRDRSRFRLMSLKAVWVSDQCRSAEADARKKIRRIDGTTIA